MNKKIAVILSGCGFKDGSEITEAVASLICLDELAVEYDIYAPDINVISKNHLSDEEQESRNILVESARIARGEIKNLQELNVDLYDGAVFPGGYGAALHLSDFAVNGARSSVLAKIQDSIKEFHSQSKPIAAFCIAPALIARVLGEHSVAVTIGNDKETSVEIEKTGAQHVECPVDDFVSDRENKIISTPAYMYDAKPFQVFTGIKKAIKEFVEMS